MARIALGCLMALLLVAGPGAARTLVDVGPLMAEANMNHNEDCNVGLDSELCAATMDTNDTATPGDDEVRHNKTIDEIALYSRASPVSEPQNLSLRPNELVVHHPGFTVANESWKSLDALLSPLNDHVSLDSMGVADKPGDDFDDSTWGLSVHAHPLGVDTPRIWIVCWDLSCARIWWGTFESEEDGIYFQSVLGSSSPWDSDAWLDEFILQGVLACSSVWRDVGCPDTTLALLRDHFAPRLELVKNETPRVQTFYQVNGTSVHVGEDSPDLQRRSGNGSVILSTRTPAAEPLPLRRNPPGPLPPADEHPVPSVTPPASPQGPPPPSDQPHRLALLASTAPDDAPSRLVLTAVAGGLALALLLGALYTRLSRDRVLNHETRRRVYNAICAEPGVRVGTIATRLCMDYTTIRHHVAILREFDLVKTAGNANNRLLPVGHLSATQEDVCTRVLANPTAKTVYEFLQARGPQDLREIAKALDLSYSTASASTVHLRKAGLVQRERQWGRWILSAKTLEERQRAPTARPLTGAS